MKLLRRIALSAGHSDTPGQDNGAINGDTKEGDLTVKFRDMVKICLQRKGIKVSVDPNNSVTGATVRLFKKYFSGTDVAIDFHFDSFIKPTASGCTAFVPEDFSDFEMDLGTELTKAISTTLDIPNRGCKPESKSARKKLLWMTIPCETILIEICFISNSSDMKKYNDNAPQLAGVVADTIAKWLAR